VSFFKELPVVLNKLKPTLLELAGSAADNIEQQLRLREWQETLVSLQHISNKYKVRTAYHRPAARGTAALVVTAKHGQQ
jgi:hypothetical protein